ncbi:Hypothetical_protein [Hexamita inflata]|uniref:Hypothetical_protein n=1 Tax=Hexamita inflata TaxID=28002 RepID=A0AA86UIG7_9EUKA|nr:Hypothetical protein HINF_LOCUS47220 [Hexamita inflata]
MLNIELRSQLLPNFIQVRLKNEIFVTKIFKNGSLEEVQVQPGKWSQQILLLQQSMNYLRLDQSFYQLLKFNFQPILKLIFDTERQNFMVDSQVCNSYSSSRYRRVLQQHSLTQFIQTVEKISLKFGQLFQQLEPKSSSRSSVYNCICYYYEVLKYRYIQIMKLVHELDSLAIQHLNQLEQSPWSTSQYLSVGIIHNTNMMISVSIYTLVVVIERLTIQQFIV